MSLPPTSRFQFTDDLNICRLLNGMWQVSGGHGRIDPQAALAAMFNYVDAGFTTWDLADHYGPAEDFVGEFRTRLEKQRGKDALQTIQTFTKWVPRPGKMTRAVVEENINISRQRMQTDCLDLLQFHWWDYGDENYLDALHHMADLQQEGKIKHLALTNFDTDHLKIILDAGIQIVSNQVQFSVVDRRPLAKMAKVCQENGVHLFAYGTLCGGFLSENYLGQPAPSRWTMKTVSQRKYFNMIRAWGGWPLFQELLQGLAAIAKKHECSIANIAVRYILDQPAVAGAIVGARLGIQDHIADNAKVFALQLDADDDQQLEQLVQSSQDLMTVIGDCGDEYR
ncbi:MAG: aldo/keto reductase [Kamptonema sp. SIO4C4]|nr:aldo/keto reductase [Kamptonema sp. SIO4C4]